MVLPRISNSERHYRTSAILLIAGILAGCATQVIPSPLADLVVRDLTFGQLKEAPAQYQARLVVFGGVVLSARRMKDSTRIEVLQLPLDYALEPTGRLTESKGRFLAFHREFLDPATLPPGTRLTVVGEVTGAETLPLDEATYTYPTLEIRSMTIWPRAYVPFRPYPFMGMLWGPPYWGPYWMSNPAPISVPVTG
jgi:outer membrane lipoprotein